MIKRPWDDDVEVRTYKSTFLPLINRVLVSNKAI